MVKRDLSLVVCVYLTAAAGAFAQSSYVFQLPGQTGLTTRIVGLGDNDFSRFVKADNGPSGASRVVATPSGSKFYILAPGGVYSANATLGAQARVAAITGAVTDAEVTPDGKYLLVVADQFYILNAANDTLAVGSNTGVPVGSTPAGVAVSHDAKTAWVLSNTTAGSTITAVDLTTFRTSATPLNLPSSGSSMVLSSRGLLYVTTNADRLYEIDPVTLSITTGGQIPVQGTAGPLQFTPDGNTAYFLFSHPCQSCPSVGKLNAASHSVSGWPSDGSTPPTIDQILVAGNNRIFALSAATTQLFDVTPTPLALTPSSLGNLPTANVVAAAVSNERSSARYLYVLVSDLNFYRVNLVTNGIDGVSSLDPANGIILSFVPIPAKTGASSLFQINPTQNVAPGASTILIGQVLDSVGRPVFGLPGSFSGDCAGMAIANPSLVTTSEGWAQTTITAPTVSGTCTVTLTVGALSARFQVIVGSGTVGGTGSQISIFSGDGQLLRQNESTIETQEPLTVKVTDAAGNALSNIAVTFQVTEGIGTVVTQEVSTDTGGFARTDFTSGPLPSGFPFELSKVAASSVYGSVEFYEMTHDATSIDLHPPNSLILTPVNQRLTIPQGGFIAGAITAVTLSGHTAQPIPNVGIRLTDPVDLTVPSSVVSCVGLTRGDNAGVSRCDVQAFCQPPGSIPPNGLVKAAIIEVGEYKSYGLEVTLTNGTPSLLMPVFGDGQKGNPSDTVTLIARVVDGCNQPVPNLSGLTWTIQGSASFSQSQTTSDSSGNVSARVTFGATPGPVRVQLSGPNLPPLVFNLTTQVVVSGISLVSGGGQSVVVTLPFPNPVVFVVRDANNNPVPGLSVNFSVSGSASINPTGATTNAQGQVQTSVTAGANPGTIVVTATFGSLPPATATLSARLPGPQLTSTSFTNAASGAAGLTPCGLATVTGNGLATTVQGSVTGQQAGLSITANNISAPILSVSNVSGVQSANFQTPCELAAGTATVVVTVNGASTTVSAVPVSAVQPGIFVVDSVKRYGWVIRAVDGSLVTPSNPARRGERLYMVATGLGQVTPAAGTNVAGTGSQDVVLPVVVGVSDAGVPVLSARYLAGFLGAYLIEFQIPQDSPIGPDQSLALAVLVNNGTTFVFGNSLFLPGVIAPSAP